MLESVSIIEKHVDFPVIPVNYENPSQYAESENMTITFAIMPTIPCNEYC